MRDESKALYRLLDTHYNELSSREQELVPKEFLDYFIDIVGDMNQEIEDLKVEISHLKDGY